MGRASLFSSASKIRLADFMDKRYLIFGHFSLYYHQYQLSNGLFCFLGDMP